MIQDVQRRAGLTPRLRGALARAPCVFIRSEVIRLAERRPLRTGGQAIGTDTTGSFTSAELWRAGREQRLGILPCSAQRTG